MSTTSPAQTPTPVIYDREEWLAVQAKKHWDEAANGPAPITCPECGAEDVEFLPHNDDCAR